LLYNTTFIKHGRNYFRKKNQMKALLLVSVFLMVTLAACVVSTGPPGYGNLVVSPLPAVIELGSDPYYYQNDYYYYYNNDSWRYSRSKGGPWTDLPRSHWPKEIKHRDRDQDHDRDYDRGRDSRHEREGH
jgi:hypothetical protein